MCPLMSLYENESASTPQIHFAYSLHNQILIRKREALIVLCLSLFSLSTAFLVIFTIFHFDLEKFISKNCKYIIFYQKFAHFGRKCTCAKLHNLICTRSCTLTSLFRSKSNVPEINVHLSRYFGQSGFGISPTHFQNALYGSVALR